MAGSDPGFESRRDRKRLARQAGLGRLSFISALAGMLVAYGAFALLAPWSARSPSPSAARIGRRSCTTKGHARSPTWSHGAAALVEGHPNRAHGVGRGRGLMSGIRTV
jgi:hypothetical protein